MSEHGEGSRLGWWRSGATAVVRRGEAWVIELAQWPELTDPVMIAAFEGWNDAGEAATSAVGHLARGWKAEPFAALDPEDYYDFQGNRPTGGPSHHRRRRAPRPTTPPPAARGPPIRR